MTRVTIDAQTLQRLRSISEGAQLCDDEGHVVGYFRPACGMQRYPEPPALPPEELSADSPPQTAERLPRFWRISQVARDVLGRLYCGC